MAARGDSLISAGFFGATDTTILVEGLSTEVAMPRARKQSELTPEFKHRFFMEITEKVRGTLDLNEVLNQIIDAIKPVVDYDAAGIFVLSKEFHRFLPKHYTHIITGTAMRGFPPQPKPDDPMLVSARGIVGYTIRTGETVIAPDIRLDTRYIEGRPQTLSEIAVPVSVGEQVIGALNLESDRLDAFNRDDAEILHFISSAAAISIEKAMLHQQLLEKRRIENQLKIAHDVQAGLLPLKPPKISGYEIGAVNIPHFNIGGDYFDYIELPNGTIGIAIADVSGKGVPAALIMATFRAALHIQLQYETDIPRMLGSVNLFLKESTRPETYVAAIFGVLEPETGRFMYVNCGHPPPLLLSADGNMKVFESRGLVLGALCDAVYEANTITLERGDVLALYTDGVVDLVLDNGGELGLRGLERHIRTNWHRPAAGIIESILDSTQLLRNGGAPSDDFTLLILRRNA
jgi:sigma-B regulation protein RsbU (phosphoserine phosphatase)